MTFLRRAVTFASSSLSGLFGPVGSPEVARRIEQQVRASYTIPAQREGRSWARLKPSEFPNYDALTITFDGGEKKQTTISCCPRMVRPCSA